MSFKEICWEFFYRECLMNPSLEYCCVKNWDVWSQLKARSHYNLAAWNVVFSIALEFCTYDQLKLIEMLFTWSKLGFCYCWKLLIFSYLELHSTLFKKDTFGTGTEWLFISERCPSYRELNIGSKERQGPTLGVHFTEVSVL